MIIYYMNNNKYNGQTAKQYDYYTEHFSMYKDLARFLVGQSQLTNGQTVLDLGCGTGIAIPYILDKIGSSGHIFAIDKSIDMLQIAESKYPNKNIKFYNLPAEEVNDVLTQKVDRVVAGTSFW